MWPQLWQVTTQQLGLCACLSLIVFVQGAQSVNTFSRFKYLDSCLQAKVLAAAALAGYDPAVAFVCSPYTHSLSTRDITRDPDLRGVVYQLAVAQPEGCKPAAGSNPTLRIFLLPLLCLPCVRCCLNLPLSLQAMLLSCTRVRTISKTLNPEYPNSNLCLHEGV